MKLTPQKQAQFVNAKPRPELDGKLGLDLHEIAESLGAEFANVKRRFLKLFDKKRLFGLPIGRTNDSSGLEVESFVLPLADARLLVMQYQNEVGFGYCKFLLSRDEQLTKIETFFGNDEMSEFQYGPILQQLMRVEREQFVNAKKTIQLAKEMVVVQEAVIETNKEIAGVKEITANSVLTLDEIQKIDAKIVETSVRLYGDDPKKIGKVRGTLKHHFGLSSTQTRYYHLKQKDMVHAIMFLDSLTIADVDRAYTIISKNKKK